MSARVDEVRTGLQADAAPDSAAILQHLQRAAEAEMARLVAVAPGRLVSLSVTLPPGLVPAGQVLGGDTRWFMPGSETALCASGVAVRYGEDEARRFDAERVHWCCLGSPRPLPLAFFTLPPATEVARPTVWIPRVLVRHDGSAAVFTLSARRGLRPPSLVVEEWLVEVRRLLSPPPLMSGGGRIAALEAKPEPGLWRERVLAARAAIAAGRFAKVVLARRLGAQLSAPVDEVALTRRLARLYPDCHVFSLPFGAGRVVAATPERLATKRGSELVSHALAGTAVHRGRAVEDRQAMEALLASAKERREHALVVEAIRARMAKLCTAVSHDAAPSILVLRFVQHLWTQVKGRLRTGIGLIEAARRLHPTPAVLGLPQEVARDWLAGERRDGLYSGVAGWVDQGGDGDAVVVLRSVYLEHERAVLWAGAGIMAESDPAAELAETELKLRTMLEVLEDAP